jgi:hypothetical protein
MIRQMHRWRLIKRGNDIPDRGDFDPVEFETLLPNILIVDIEHAPFRVRYRVVGTRVVGATAFDITGRYPDDLMPTEPEAPWLDLYARTVQLRAPTLGTSTCTTTCGGLFTHDFAMFPLRNGGESVDQVLSIEDDGNLFSTLTDLVDWRLKSAKRATVPAHASLQQLRPARQTMRQ